MDFLPGALDLDPVAFGVDGDFAGRVLWFDALVGNVDRSWRNPNLLFWHGRLHLIDHGAPVDQVVAGGELAVPGRADLGVGEGGVAELLQRRAAEESHPPSVPTPVRGGVREGTG